MRSSAPRRVSEQFRSHDKAHVLEFNEKNHRYKLDGAFVPGVTTLIKATLPEGEGLINWRVKQAVEYVHSKWRSLETMPESVSDWELEVGAKALIAHRQKLDEAGNIGTALHNYIEAIEAGQTPPPHGLTGDLEAAFVKAVAAYNQYTHEHGPIKLLHAELGIASPTYKYAGKFDRLHEREGKVVLSDFKTSKAIYPSHLIQLGGYSLALREWMDVDVDELEILRFGKDGEFEPLTIADKSVILELEGQFVRCRQTFDFLKKYDSR